MVDNLSQTSILDEETMAQMRELAPNSKWLHKLYDQFMVQTQEQLLKLKDALETSDQEACSFLLHAMKSSARQVGAVQFAKQLEDFEKNFKPEKPLSSLQVHQQLELQFARFGEKIKVALKHEKGTA